MFTQEAAQQRSEGYALYEEKPNLRRRDRKQIGTWSDEEYGLAGFQWMYDKRVTLCLVSLRPRSETTHCACTAISSVCTVKCRYLRLKSFQRFTETWALLERCAA
eukprot:COSAG02_NODE_21896_length_771_cov_0.761905_3_plen_104_part_01